METLAHRLRLKRQGPFMEEIFRERGERERERERKERKQRQEAEKGDNVRI